MAQLRRLRAPLGGREDTPEGDAAACARDFGRLIARGQDGGYADEISDEDRRL